MKAIKTFYLTEQKAERLVIKLNAKSVFGSLFTNNYPYSVETEKYRIHILEDQYIKYPKN